MAATSTRGRWLLHRRAKPVLFVLCLLPLAWLVWGAATGGLGANPAERLIRATGDWTLRLLCLTLAVTPLRKLLHLPQLARFRRMLGLYTFGYALAHLLCYAGFDMGLDVQEIARDVAQRPFILVGVSTFGVLVTLAATSFQPLVRWLGGVRWRRLHRLVYLAAGLALLHFFWMRAGKRDFAEVFLYGAIIAALLGTRVVLWLRRTPSGSGATAVAYQKT